MVVKLTSDIKEIDKVLERFGGHAEDPMKPNFKVVFLHVEEKGKVQGYLYVYDIFDGYFRKCFIDDLDTGDDFDEELAEKLMKKLRAYCRKEKIYHVESELGSYYPNDKEKEIKLYKSLGFEIKDTVNVWS